MYISIHTINYECNQSLGYSSFYFSGLEEEKGKKKPNRFTAESFCLQLYTNMQY